MHKLKIPAVDTPSIGFPVAGGRAAGILFCGLLAIACGRTPQPLQPAFYHWQTRLALSPPEITYLDSLNCRKLYVKFLDIARDDNGIQPYSLLEVSDTAGLRGKTIVPCVFLTNSVFTGISEEKTNWLAERTALSIRQIGGQFPEPVFPEIQFDCDWTGATRAAFFNFLKKIKPLLPEGTTISATIRLHQYKFPGQTGVPPVDRGMLMLYNTGDIDSWETSNSIFSREAALVYLRGAPKNYPLPLDAALPVFSWALVYRDDALWKIVPEPDTEQLRDSAFFEALPDTAGAATRFRIRQPTFMAGHYLRTDDLVRVEALDTAALAQAARLAAGLKPDASVAFYYLETATLRRYPARFLNSIWKILDDR